MIRNEIVGVDELTPVSNSLLLRYVNLDNAATTPALRCVVEAVTQFLPLASSVHRGTGFKSRASTEAFEEARQVIGEFVGADPDHDVVVFTRNTTEAINLFARTMALPEEAVVLTTVLEHHSNLLPWRLRSPVVHVRSTPDGSLDEDDLDAQLARYGGRVALLAVTGASNVTGITPPIHRLASKVHAVGGRILVDAAQLAGHRRIDMRPHSDPGHIDIVAMSAHKMYAPFGSGALIADRSLFGAEPDYRGGGTVRAVTLDDVVWDGLPDRFEAGTPNLLGAIAMAAAAKRLSKLGLDNIAAHEQELAGWTRNELLTLPGVNVLGAAGSLGVIPFSVDGWDPRLVAAVLGDEHGVGVRAGCFCAHPYVAQLLGLNRSEISGLMADARRGEMRAAPGLVRISLGCYSDRGDIDRVIEGLEQLISGDVRHTYRQELDGSFIPNKRGPARAVRQLVAAARRRTSPVAYPTPRAPAIQRPSWSLRGHEPNRSVS